MKLLLNLINPKLNVRLMCVLKRNIVRYESNAQNDHIKEVPDYVDLSICPEWNKSDVEIDNIKRGLLKGMNVIENFVTEEEENAFIDEIQPVLRKMRYEFDHWDDAIHGFKETERINWREDNAKVIERARNICLRDPSKALPHVHVLDLDEKGHIKPHVDALRFCGSTVAGMCLLSSGIMRLRHTQKTDLFADFLLSRRCFYIMRDSARYDFSHEILKNDLSYFKQQCVERKRRISIIIRNLPNSE